MDEVMMHGGGISSQQQQHREGLGEEVSLGVNAEGAGAGAAPKAVSGQVVKKKRSRGKKEEGEVAKQQEGKVSFLSPKP